MIAAGVRLPALRAGLLSLMGLMSCVAGADAGPGADAGGPSGRPARAVIGMQLEPPVLDPTANPAAAISEALYANLYEGLVRFAPDGSVLPLLAESWRISDDGLTYIFHLRAGVRFHNGVAFDAATAKFSLERALKPGFGQSPALTHRRHSLGPGARRPHPVAVAVAPLRGAVAIVGVGVLRHAGTTLGRRRCDAPGRHGAVPIPRVAPRRFA